MASAHHDLEPVMVSEEVEHTADRAFRVRGRNLAEQKKPACSWFCICEWFSAGLF